ncbi:uncharacterized protein LOC136087916 [Hydra vulgaris]|uniref:Uncharacterized protein LOC136087916 n=1 Tax=Hydra vulgaris TaxID=6087 RepID=A0ABM4D060_HYDVU
MERTSILTGETITTASVFRTNNQVVLETTDLNELYENTEHNILESLSSLQQLGSGCRFVSVEMMEINIIEYNPIKAKSYIPLDKKLGNKNAIIYIKNEDNQCFKWCVARALNPKDNHPKRVDKEIKNQSENINWDNIEFPVSLNQITQFENNNRDTSVNVFGYENSEVHIKEVHVSKNNERKHLIDLLLISNGETNHYYLIKSLGRLLSSRHQHKVYYCRNRLLEFNSEESLSNHKRYCETHDSVCIELPQQKSTMQFASRNKSMRVPNPVTFTSTNETDDVVQIFVDSLEKGIKKICNKIKFPKRMILTDENKHDFNAAISCHICGRDLENDKVRDHCHITGKYKDAAHQIKLSGGKLNCIPNNEEKYISFSKEIKVDEFINKGEFSKRPVKNIGKLYSGKKLDLLLRKGIYPYNWVDSIDRFNETQSQPKESFFSRLNSEGISDDDYSHAQIVRKEFNCESFRDYHDLYVSDVLLLPDVFENFRDVYTDSLAYEIKTEDVYADIANDIESKFDTSEFDKNHPAINNVGLKVGVNKKVIGMFKDESGRAQIEEFVGLRSKLYSYKVHGEEKKKCKGVRKNVVKNYITHEDYKNCLLNKMEHIRRMNVIKSYKNEIYTEEINKVALSAEDDKRVILEDGIHTLAYGHCILKENNL